MNPFIAHRVVRTAEIRLQAAPDLVFSLFTPLGEKRWAAEWNPTMIYPSSGDPEVGAIFVTHHHDMTATVWIIEAFEPQDHRIRYARVTP